MIKSARVWDLATGKLLTILRPPIGDDNEGETLRCGYFSRWLDDCRRGIYRPGRWSTNYPIYLFDRASGRLTRRIGGLPDATQHLAFSFDGRLLAASLGGQNGIRVFRASDGTEVRRDSEYKDNSFSVEFDRKGRLLATSYDGELRLYGPAPEFKLLAKRSAPGGNRSLFRALFPRRFARRRWLWR